MAFFKLYNEENLEDGRISRSYMLPLNKSLGYACKVMELPSFSNYEATVTGYILPDDLKGTTINSVDDLHKYGQQYKSVMFHLINGVYNGISTDIYVDLETDMLYVESDSVEIIEKMVGELL